MSIEEWVSVWLFGCAFFGWFAYAIRESRMGLTVPQIVIWPMTVILLVLVALDNRWNVWGYRLWWGSDYDRNF